MASANKDLRKKILAATDGVLEAVTDYLLYAAFYQLAVLDRPSRSGVLYYAPEAADRSLDKINYQTIKRAVNQLLRRGMVEKQEQNLVLTAAGKKRLQKIMPSLDPRLKRQEGEIYLITYDIAETSRSGRDFLRRFLRQEKAIPLQESVFLTTEDLRAGITSFLQEGKIRGQVLITKLGRDSVLGGEGITAFLWEVYGLEKLARRYGEFIQRFSVGNRGKITLPLLDFAFNSIYRDDPRFPREFLPANWPGEKARQLYQKLSRG